MVRRGPRRHQPTTQAGRHVLRGNRMAVPHVTAGLGRVLAVETMLLAINSASDYTRFTSANVLGFWSGAAEFSTHFIRKLSCQLATS